MIELALLAFAGLAAGYVNAIAGAGSLLTLPALIFTGLDASVANATNRVAVLFQNAAAMWAYRRGGATIGPRARWLVWPAVVGGVLGAGSAGAVGDRGVRLALAIAMPVFLVLSFVRPRRPDTTGADPAAGLDPTWGKHVALLAIGFYAGFLQAGVGIVILLYLGGVYGVDLVRVNAFKVLVIFWLTVAAIATFVLVGVAIDPARGAVLATATTLGGYLGARSALRGGERFVRVVLVVTVLASAAKLAWDASSAG